MCPICSFLRNWVTFTEEILNGKFQFCFFGGGGGGGGGAVLR